MSIDHAIARARHDVIGARLHALLYPHPDTAAERDAYEAVLDEYLDARPAYHPPEEAP